MSVQVLLLNILVIKYLCYMYLYLFRVLLIEHLILNVFLSCLYDTFKTTESMLLRLLLLYIYVSSHSYTNFSVYIKRLIFITMQL